MWAKLLQIWASILQIGRNSFRLDAVKVNQIFTRYIPGANCDYWDTSVLSLSREWDKSSWWHNTSIFLPSPPVYFTFQGCSALSQSFPAPIISLHNPHTITTTTPTTSLPLHDPHTIITSCVFPCLHRFCFLPVSNRYCVDRSKCGCQRRHFVLSQSWKHRLFRPILAARLACRWSKRR